MCIRDRGNTADVLSAVERFGGRAVRLYLAGPHYRSAIELSEESLADAAAQLARIDSFLGRARELIFAQPFTSILNLHDSDAWTAFAAAMDDDLSTPAALAVVFNSVREGNAAIAAGDVAKVRASWSDVTSMLDVFGLNPDAVSYTHLDVYKRQAELVEQIRTRYDALWLSLIHI